MSKIVSVMLILVVVSFTLTAVIGWLTRLVARWFPIIQETYDTINDDDN